MSYRFHDEDYEGIVLKISSGHLATNPEFVKALEDFHKALEECKFSTFHWDYEMNLHELRNYKSKSEDIRKNREEAEQSRVYFIEKTRIRNEKLANHEILPISTYKIYDIVDLDNITIDGVEFDMYKEIMNKNGVRKAFKNAFTSFVAKSSKQQIIEWLKDNRIFGTYMTEFPIDMIDFNNVNWLMDRYGGCLKCVIEVPAVEVYQRGKKKTDNLYYRIQMIKYNSQIGLFIESGLENQQIYSISGGTRGACKLEEYEKIGDEFILLKTK